jgi:hypothetical protein
MVAGIWQHNISRPILYPSIQVQWSCTLTLRIIRSAPKRAKRPPILLPLFSELLEAIPLPASGGAGARLSTRLPRQHTTMPSIPEVSGSILCCWNPIGSMWCVDRTHPTGYDVPESDLGGDI